MNRFILLTALLLLSACETTHQWRDSINAGWADWCNDHDFCRSDQRPSPTVTPPNPNAATMAVPVTPVVVTPAPPPTVVVVPATPAPTR